MSGQALTRQRLDGVRSLLAVVAHPDDESFALGALLDWAASHHIETSVLCLTHGEASTLHAQPGDLGAIRAGELRVAAEILGVATVVLRDYPDGRLDEVPVARLAGEVSALIADRKPSHLLVFDTGGVTGHPDHVRATAAALIAARASGQAVLGWALPLRVTRALNAQLGTGFVGRDPQEIDVRLRVSRERQHRAIDAHASQAKDNPVLRRRLRLQRDREDLRVLYQPVDTVPLLAQALAGGRRLPGGPHELGASVPAAHEDRGY